MSDFSRILKRQLIKVLIALALFLIVAWFMNGGKFNFQSHPTSSVSQPQ